ncbi:DUF6286 domain-containing protein, partial [Actinomadura yumaensis]
VPDRAARRAFRSRRVWPAMLAGLLLAAAGIITAIEVVSALVGKHAGIVPYERATSWLTGHDWKSWPVLAIAGAVALVGLLFLLAGLLPGRSGIVPLHGEHRDLVMGITRRGLKGAAKSAAREVDGVTGVRKVGLRRHRVIVHADTAMRTPGGLDEDVRRAVQRRLDGLGPLPRRRAVAHVTYRES